MIRRGSVNWQDGMLIQASHFIAETTALIWRWAGSGSTPSPATRRRST